MIFVNDIKRLAATNSQTAHNEHQLTQQHSSFVQLKVSLELCQMLLYKHFKRIGLLLTVLIVFIPISIVSIGHICSKQLRLPFVAVLMTHAYMLQ